MAFNTPDRNPLTDSQAELVARISSMQSLLTLPLVQRNNVPKDKQISTFDYLSRVSESLGLQLEFVFSLFLSRVLDEAGTFLEENVLDSLAETIAKKGRALPDTNLGVAVSDQATIDSFKQQNLDYFNAVIPNNFLSVAKQQIAKDLTIMMFGNGPAAETLNPDPVERQRLVESAVCAAENFTISNPPIVRNQDLEFNRIALKRQLEAGQVEFEISCQTVKISLPEDPTFIFEGGGTGVIEGQAVTPAQSLEVLVDWVRSETQSINNQNNSNRAGKSFFQILIEKMIGYMSTLIYGYLGPVFEEIQTTDAGSDLTRENTIHDSCSILNNPEDQETKEFSERLGNRLLKALLSILLLTVIRYFKRLVANYFARTFLERQRRKAEKIKARFGLIGNVAENADRAQRYAAATSAIRPIIGDINIT